jgi:acyl-CoA thioesterase-2
LKRRSLDDQTDAVNSSLTAMLPIAPRGEDRFRAGPEGSTGFLFGGLTMAVAVAVAGRTVEPDLVPKSLRSAFLSTGEWAAMDVAVERVNTSRSFSGRRLRLEQDGRELAVADVTFHRPEEGIDRSYVAPPSLPEATALGPGRSWSSGLDVMEVRPLAAPEGAMTGRLHPYWAKIREDLGDGPLINGAALAFMSDFAVIYSPFDPSIQEAVGWRSLTLEHSLWFHRPFLASHWLLFDAGPLTRSGGRYVTRGTVYDERGVLVASFVQEGVIRRVDTGEPRRSTRP